MAHLIYVSRTDNAHDRRWVAALRHGGHDVVVADVADLRNIRPADLVVAGPLTDITAAAVDADVAPVLAVSWAFDVLIEAQDPRIRSRLTSTLPRCAGVHVDCQAMVEQVVGLGADPRTVSVAAWGIDTDLFSPGAAGVDVSGRAGLGPDQIVVFSDRAWRSGYDIDVVLAGFAAARRLLPQLRLVLAGSGPDQAAVLAQIMDLELADQVVTPGRLTQAELVDWLRSADVYLSAAASDGTSLSLLEALACGLRAVVTDVGGNPEWVRGPSEGRLFAVGDAEALSSALLGALADGDDAERRATRRRRVLDGGRWEDNRTKILAAVDRALLTA